VKKYKDAGNPLPQAAIDALHNNFSDDNQRLYGLLNEFDFSRNCGYTYYVPSGGFGKAYFTEAGSLPNWIIANYPDSWSPTSEVPDSALPALADVFAACYLKKTLNESNFNHDYAEYGSPFWTQAQRQDAYRKALGSFYPPNAPDVTNSKDWIDIWAQAYVNTGIVGGGKSADQYEDPADVPGMTNPYQGEDNGLFDGLLPYKPEEIFASAEAVRDTKDTTQHYKNECNSKSLIEELLPIGCAVIAGGVSGMIIPGQISKVIAAGVGGISTYSVVSSIYGQQALMWWGTSKRNDGEKLAARLITVGFPAAFAMGLVELGYVPAFFSTFEKKSMLVFGSGALGYVLFEKPLEDGLVLGGDAAEIMLSPISWLDGFFHNWFDGCDKHTGNNTLQCYCENANAKPLMAEAIVEDIYGATDQQAKLRVEAMHASMTTGDWGSDPISMGICDPNTGWMDSPTACISPEAFAYQTWDPSMNPKAQNMWNQIAFVVDPNNPSFLPPTPQDKMCSAYGPYARQGGVILPGATGDRWPQQGVTAGKCYDFRAPIGQQEMNQPNTYDWSQIQQPANESCIIL
jgi:hypothetical protein